MEPDPRDFIDDGVVSDCCQAPVMLGDMCSECKEHCCPEMEDESDTKPEEQTKP